MAGASRVHQWLLMTLSDGSNALTGVFQTRSMCAYRKFSVSVLLRWLSAFMPLRVLVDVSMPQVSDIKNADNKHV